jgi:enolase
MMNPHGVGHVQSPGVVEAVGAPSNVATCLTAASAAAAVEQCEVFLSGLGADAYVTPSAVMHGGTIGQHVRHAIDHYDAAIAGLRGESIAYDRRERGTRIETDVGEARTRLREIARVLRTVTPSRSASSVRVRVMIESGSGLEAEHESTLGRELAFAAHHAVHHHAMIAAIAKAMGVAVPAGFGKAPATIHHEAHG